MRLVVKPNVMRGPRIDGDYHFGNLGELREISLNSNDDHVRWWWLTVIKGQWV